MAQRPLRSILAALLLGATLLLPWLAGSAAGAAQPAPRRPAAAASAPAGPFARLWQALVQLVRGSSVPGAASAPGNRVLPDAGCSMNPDGHCAAGSQADAGCSANPDGHCGS
jgi:hypothetical protein